MPVRPELQSRRRKLYWFTIPALAMALSPLAIRGTDLHLIIIACGWLALFVVAVYAVKLRSLWLLTTMPVLCLTAFISQWNASIGHPPSIAQDVHFVMKGMPVADPEWTATLKRQFPIGTSEAKVVSVLKGQGFLIDQRDRVAHYEWSEAVCRVIIEAQWTTGPDERITSIEGTSAGMCL